MTQSGRDVEALGSRESKAIHILLSAKKVAEDVEVFRRCLNDPHLSRAEKERHTAEMNEALSRLCNLISLAIANINESVGEQFRLSFDILLDEVRSRLLQMNFHLIQERLIGIRDQVEKALHDPVHRLGLSDRLARAYDDAVNMLTAMGETTDLGLPPRFLEDIIGQIRELSAIEIRAFKLIDFDAHPPKPAPAPAPASAPREPGEWDY